MIREIKTTLAIDGEKEFKAALTEAEREMRVMNADLKAMSAEFKATDDAQRYYTQRSETLNSKVRQQEEIVEALTKAVRESAEAYGNTARQTDDYRIRLSNAKAKLFDMRREAEQANRDLEELGRDSGKIGRQIERGIGDAAEDTADKLDGMFAKVAKDVNALKSSVAFQTTMEIGGFVMDSIQSVVGFVQENDEYNRQIAITKYNIEKYGHNWDDALNLIIDAAAITANREGAFEAISNLTSSGVQDQALIEAAVDALLGVFITTGGALSFESLAEDFRASVVSRVPTGTYAEVLEELLQGIVLEDVEKALGEMKTVDDAFQLALSYLTEGGYQTTTRNFEEQHQEFLEAQRKQEELAGAWAALAMEIQPVVTSVIEGTTTLVEGITKIIDIMNGIDFGEEEAKELNKAIEEYYTNPENEKSFGRWWADFWGITPPKYRNNGATYQNGEFEKSLAERSLWEWLFPSAGAETLPTTELEGYGFEAWQEVANGMMHASEENPAVDAAIKTALAEMKAQDVIDEARLAGKNLMIEFGNGIAEGTSIPLNNVANMVNQINAMLSQIAAPAFGLGWSGMTGGNIYLYNQQKNAANTISRFIGRGVQPEMLKK